MDTFEAESEGGKRKSPAREPGSLKRDRRDLPAEKL
jgi:hypothetical protein